MTVLSTVFADLLVSGGPPVAIGALDGGSVVVGGAAISAAAAGLVGSSIVERFLGDDDGEDGGDDLDGGDDPFGDLGSDLGDDGDEFGMDEYEEDPFGEGGADEGATVELQERVDELEDEVASLSSTVNTVRSENKEISETVEEISEDVRGLLDIYEMVTRGINPFVDEGNDSLGGGGFEGEDSLGLFDDDGGDDSDESDDLDDDIAGADAESFFDDDPLDEGDDGGDFDEMGDPDGAEDDLDMMDDDTAGDDTPADGAGGKSFDELKAEYESGDAEWAGADDDTGDDARSGDFGGDALDGGFDDDRTDGGSGAPGAAPGDDRRTNGHEERAGRDGGFEFVGDGAKEPRAPTKPYLTRLPEGYVGDLIVIEWLESLVEESDPTDAARAVGYYERVEWISEDVAERLRDFLTGFGPIDANKVDDPGTEMLTLDHHVRSLQYIRQLDGASAESLVVGRWDRISDGPGGRGGDRRSLLGGDLPEVDHGR